MPALEDLDDDLRRLTLHDVGVDRAERTRAACLEVMRARNARRHSAAPRASWTWLEPAAALAISVLYLATALRAATVLMMLR